MLDVLAPVSPVPDTAWVATTPGGVPPELVACGTPGMRAGVRTVAACPCCAGPAIPLRVGWVFATHGVVFLRAPATYCATRRHVLLGPHDTTALAARVRRLATEVLERAETPHVGVNERVRRPLLGTSVLRVLRARDGDLRYAPAVDALVASDVSEALPAGALPDHVAFHSLALPEQLTVKLEPTTRCNFDCGFCYGRHIEQGNLAWADFGRILGAIPGVQAVELTGEGEPLVHKWIFDFVAECHRRGIQTHITTNASLLTEAASVKLLDAGLASLAVSLESMDSDRFRQLRPGGDLVTVLAGIERFQRLRVRREPIPKFALWVSVLRETVPELEIIQRRAAEMGVDGVWFQCLNPMQAYRRFYDVRLAQNILTEEEIERLAEDRATPAATRAALRQTLTPFQGVSCDIFTHTVNVTWQGHVTPCCLLKVPDFLPLGIVTRESLATVWERPRFRRFRFALEHGILLESCRDCPDVTRA